MNGGKRAVGTKHENEAALFLENRGYRILARSYTIRGGEIDIIAESTEGVIVFCEVKFRSGTSFGDAVEAVTPKKQRRICRTALDYISKNGLYDRACRFDVITIQAGKTYHIENAFEYIE